jgi:uncharacterized protein (DUF58 family)
MSAPPLSATPPAATTSAPAGRASRLQGLSRSLSRSLSTFLIKRQGVTDTLTLTQRNVYILPTRPGLMLAATLLLLLLSSINYQLNLGYLLTFLLAGSAVVGMHVSHGTLRGLAMSMAPPPAGFAGRSTAFTVKLTNARRSVRRGIGLRLVHAAQGAESGKGWTWTDVGSEDSSTVQIAFIPSQRGLNRLPPLMVETRFPLGTFRVWTVWQPAAQLLAYPAPEADAPRLPAGEARTGMATAAARSRASNEFDGVRAYRRGDTIRQIVWKQAAKADQTGHGLVVRDAQQMHADELWLDIHHTGLPDSRVREAQLSRLCAWVLEAERLGLTYGLRLPSLEIAPASGDAHQRQCLEALALC